MRYGILIYFLLILCFTACSLTKREYNAKTKFVKGIQYTTPDREKRRNKVHKIMDKKKRRNIRENIQKEPK